LAGKCPATPILEGGGEGHNIKGNDPTGKPFGILRAVSFVERPRLQGVKLHKASGKGIEK